MNDSQIKFSKIKFLYRAFKYRFKDDKHELNYIISTIKSGDLVLDIGAHKGGYLHWIRKAVGNSGEVIAFEPQSILFDYLNKAIDGFSYKNITLHHGGVSSENGVLKLFIPKPEGGTSPGATLEQREDTSSGHFQEVPVYKLDDLLKDRTQKIALIKLDVEGHELEVFKGAKEILLKDKPTIVFECENRHLQNLQVEDVFEFLVSLGYAGFFFDQGELISIKNFDASIHQKTNNNEIVDKTHYANNFVFA